MRSRSTHPTGIAQSLFTIFVLPSLHKSLPGFTRASRATVAYGLISHKPNRSFSSSAPHLSKPSPSETRAPRWDEQITAKVLYLVNHETNKLSEPVTRYDVLRSYDKKTHRLVQVSADEPNNPEFRPICKIVSKKEQYAADKRRKETQKETMKTTKAEKSVKTLELNWAIDPNDLGHRLNRMQEFLGEGRKVEVVFAAKKRGRKATEDECEALLRRIRDAVDAVPGAKESKSLEGKLGSFAQLMLEGRAQKTA